jgi:hypothetical protein
MIIKVGWIAYARIAIVMTKYFRKWARYYECEYLPNKSIGALGLFGFVFVPVHEGCDWEKYL